MSKTSEDLGDLLLDPEFHAGDPHPLYRRLRRDNPVYWSEAGQFWALTAYDEVKRVGQDARTFSSTRGTLLSDAKARDAGGPHMPGAHHLIRSDGKDHRDLRGIVARSFTPAAVARLEARTRTIVRDLIDSIDGSGTLNAVEALSAPATTYVIAELMGIPQERWSDFWMWTDTAMWQVDNSGDPTRDAHIADLLAFFGELIEQRRTQPGQDIITDLVQGSFRGEPLNEVDLLTYSKLLLTAGTETTRTLITGGLELLAQHPDQRQMMIDDPTRTPDAVEEMLRMVSPVIAFGRTATTDVELNGELVRNGDYVVQFYASANRDENVWQDAERFDITRAAHKHLAFGHGPHICLGAPLARMEARVIFDELLAAFPAFELDGDKRTRGNTLVKVVERLPVVFGPRRPRTEVAA